MSSGQGAVRRRKLFVFLIAIFVISAFLIGGDGLLKSFALKRKIDRLEAKVDSLAYVNEQMKVKIEGLKKGDKAVLEEEARSLGLIKPGEKVYLLKDEKERKKEKKE